MDIHLKSAVFSDCGKYRYWLRRRLDEFSPCRPLIGILLNPSRAGHDTNDTTTNLMCGMARRWSYTDWIAVNLFGLVDTYPAGLLKVDDPVGPENDTFIIRAVRFAAEHGGTVLTAWGNHGGLLDRSTHVRAMLAREGVAAMTFGPTKSGEPKFPRAIRKDSTLVPLLEQSAK